MICDDCDQLLLREYKNGQDVWKTHTCLLDGQFVNVKIVTCNKLPVKVSTLPTLTTGNEFHVLEDEQMIIPNKIESEPKKKGWPKGKKRK
jgi:hypothetical protein